MCLWKDGLRDAMVLARRGGRGQEPENVGDLHNQEKAKKQILLEILQKEYILTATLIPNSDF